MFESISKGFSIPTTQSKFLIFLPLTLTSPPISIKKLDIFLLIK